MEWKDVQGVEDAIDVGKEKFNDFGRFMPWMRSNKPSSSLQYAGSIASGEPLTQAGVPGVIAGTHFLSRCCAD